MGESGDLLEFLFEPLEADFCSSPTTWLLALVFGSLFYGSVVGGLLLATTCACNRD